MVNSTLLNFDSSLLSSYPVSPHSIPRYYLQEHICMSMDRILSLVLPQRLSMKSMASAKGIHFMSSLKMKEYLDRFFLVVPNHRYFFHLQLDVTLRRGFPKGINKFLVMLQLALRGSGHHTRPVFESLICGRLSDQIVKPTHISF